MNYLAIPGTAIGHNYQSIQNTIRGELGISETDFMSKSRASEIVEARQLTAYFARTKLGLTFHTIGRLMNRDHATAIAGIRRISDLIDCDKRIRELVVDFTKKFGRIKPESEIDIETVGNFKS